MLRKLRLQALLFIGLFICQLASAQVNCGTAATPEEWDTWFNKAVEKEAEKMQSGKSQVVTRIIPVIVHIVYFNEPLGTFPNIDSNQVISQIDALNADFAGQGDGISNLPSAFASASANTGIQFCRAAVDYSGTPMVEQGINRISAAANNWQSLSTPTLDLKSYFNNVIIPATVSLWDPAKYLNIFISDRPASSTLMSFGTYPPNSGQIGIFSNEIGTSSNDGMWIYARAFGTIGSAQAPFNKGRTTTHQMGHYFGLKHIWGDGNCLSDYVDDTPRQKGPSSGCPTVPTQVDVCGVNESPNGNMVMNFMDETDDACRYMFTHGQRLRMWTALNQSPLRSSLGTHGFCSIGASPSSSAAVAMFSLTSKPCLQANVMPDNRSSGFPHPTYLWSASPSAAFFPNNTASHPFIQFTNPGTYVLTLVATNSVSSSSHSVQVSVQFTCQPENICLDSLRMMKKTDSLTILRSPSSSQVASCGSNSNTGYLAGTNCYQDKEFAQFYPANTYSSINYPQVNSVIILFDSASAKPSSGSLVSCKIYGGTAGGGPSGSMGTPKTASIGAIAASPKTVSVNYIGKPGYVVPGRKIIPYKFDFAKPIVITSQTNGFFAALELPTAGYQDSISIFTDTKTNLANDSSAWFRNYFGTWRTFRYNRGANVHLAIIPQITCSAITGIKDEQLLSEAYFNVMPNPTAGEFSIVLSMPREEQKISVCVRNMLGQELRSWSADNVSTHVAQVDLRDEAQGVYFVEISNGRQKVVKKIVLQH